MTAFWNLSTLPQASSSLPQQRDTEHSAVSPPGSDARLELLEEILTRAQAKIGELAASWERIFQTISREVQNTSQNLQADQKLVRTELRLFVSRIRVILRKLYVWRRRNRRGGPR